MKKIISIVLLMALVLSLAACAKQEQQFSNFTMENGDYVLTRGDITVTVSGKTGLVTQVKNSHETIAMEGILIDAGIGGTQVFEQLGYMDLSTLATYELPNLYARRRDMPGYAVDAITATEEGFTISVTCGGCNFLYNYKILAGALALEVSLSTTGETVAVNGVGFLVQGLNGYGKATFEFPGSTPAGQRKLVGRYRVTSADYAAPAIVIADENVSHSILFVDEVEKWTAGVYADQDNRPCAAFLAAVEGYLEPEKPMTVGTLYLPLSDGAANAYQRISGFWAQLGYHTPTDTGATEDLMAIYSGHPFGTMDTNYFNRWTLDEYAQRIGPVAEMGFDAIWLLPVFAHSGDNVYEPIDQGLIDIRYGGLEAARVFVSSAHELGLKVLFDFVPHGPRPVYGFAKDHDHWVSKDREGNNQIEWECVSFDYNHPEYHDYNVALAKYYASEIGLDGARIDCSMGGLPNWQSAAGYRASAAGLQAGLDVVGALREGFKAGGADVLLLPENFHPSPSYAATTDVFYDMPLYRCLYELNQMGYDETETVARLTQFLTAEHESSVKGQLKLRFLGNHDTVTWTFDARRAQRVYGTEKAKGLWKAIGWIDGVLYIYQGDEDPATYNLKGENLEGFFKDLIAAKREYLPNTLDTTYIQTGSPIFAFYRHDDTVRRLVLVNLSEESQSYGASGVVLAAIGDYTLSGSSITLAPYTGVILDASCPGE